MVSPSWTGWTFDKLKKSILPWRCKACAYCSIITALASPKWERIWKFKWLLCLNLLLQIGQPNGCILVWVRICCLRWTDCEKHLQQIMHLNGFTFVWVRKCWSRPAFWVNALVQNLQTKGRIPECIRMCCCRPPTWVKRFAQILHWCGFILACTIRLCSSNWKLSRNVNPQVRHEKDGPFRCSIWAVNEGDWNKFLSKRFSQTWHLNAAFRLLVCSSL